MKKALLILLAALSVCSCGIFNPIVLDTHYQGSRVILTSNRQLFGEMQIALGFKIQAKDTVMAILITSTQDTKQGIFNQGDKLQIRTSDNKVIELSNLYDREYEKETNTGVSSTPHTEFGYAYSYSPYTGSVYLTPYTATHMVERAYCYTTTYSYALYPITKSQLTNIINKGVIKLRVETDSDKLDMPYTDGVSRTLNRQLNDLRDAAKRDRKKEKGSF